MRKFSSPSELAAIQSQFEAEYADHDGVVGVGVSRNQAQTNLALKVYVTDESIARKMPPCFQGAEVVVNVVGPAMAF